MTAVPSPRFGFPIGPWRPWFAWHPVHSFDGVWCWLRPMVRRRIQLYDYLSFGQDQWWQYALPGDVATPTGPARVGAGR